jgi:ribonucleoside-triphosphate reductase (formate)
MFSQIKKRDGSIVLFNRDKIVNAIYRAATAVGGKDKDRSRHLTEQVIKLAQERSKEKVPNVELLQDVIEKVLIEEGHAKTAKAFILFRERKKKIREMEVLLKSIELVDDYIGRADWRIKENSNMDYSLQGLNNFISTQLVSKYWLNKIYSHRVKDAHIDGDLHVHDLGTLGAYCVGWDLKAILLDGFKGAAGKIESLPAKHFRTALGQLVNFIFTMQGEAAGAQAVSSFDTLLAPFIAYDKLTYQEVKQGLQEFLYNMNVPTRVGFQTPFSNITLDLKVPNHMKEEKVIIGGKEMEKSYGDFQEEMNMLNRAFSELMMQGDAKGRVFTFPIPTYNITKDFDWDNPEYGPIWEMTRKYGIPYFSNFVNSDMKPEDARSMCCRLRLNNRDLEKRGGGLFGANPLTGSIGVVTINLARVGHISRDEHAYFERLNYLMEVAKESLELKRKILEKFTDSGLYPYSKYYLREIKQNFNCFWMNHFATIGVNGMNESVLNFMGQSITTPEGKEFALKVMDFMREKMSDYQEETSNLYNLEATPAEGCTFRFAKKDKELYPEIMCANEEAYLKGAKPYYTNSSQLPVDYTNDLFEALELQDDLQCKYTGGTVLHAFLGERISSNEVTKKLLQKVMYNYNLPYISLTPTFSICQKHGYLAGEHEYCPKCDEEIGYNKVEEVSVEASIENEEESETA